MKARIAWNGHGGELDATVVEHSGDDRALTQALIELVKDGIVSPGDSFTVTEVDEADAPVDVPLEQREFFAVWDKPTYTPASSSVRGSFFSASNGYSFSDVDAIRALAVGATWRDTDHTVRRIS